MSVALNLKVVPFWVYEIQSSRETFPAKEIRMTSSTKSTMTVTCSLKISTDFIEKMREKVGNYVVKQSSIQPVHIPSNLRVIDTLPSLGVDRYFQSERNTVLEDTYKLWKDKNNIIFKDVSCRATVFRLLREEGYQVSADELGGPFVEQISDVATILELYKASQARLYEDEDTLEKLHDWSSNLLKQHLLNRSIRDEKLHNQVEYLLKNYHGILGRVAARQNLELCNINPDGFPDADFIEFSRRDFNICQAQHQEELKHLQRWYADCRLDTLNFRTDAVRIANFLTSAIFVEPQLSQARLAFAKHIVMVGLIDDFFDNGGSREEAYEVLDLVQEWKEKPAEEYGSKEVEILFTALYDTVNSLAEKAYIEQGRCVKHLLIKPWVDLITNFKKQMDSWTQERVITLDEYLSTFWLSIGCRVCILNSMYFLGIKLSDEMLSSQECLDLCRHVSLVVRLLNDVQTFERERLEKTINGVSIQLAVNEGERAVIKDEAMSKIREIADCNRRKLMQIVYKQGTVFPRECKHVFLTVCRFGYYLYSSSDEFTSPQQMKEDMKSLVYEPLIVLD